MSQIRPLTELIRNRRPASVVLAGLINDKQLESQSSREAGQQLTRQAAEFGLSMRDYLTLAIDVDTGDTPLEKHISKAGLNGYEAALAYLGLPVRNDFKSGVVLQAAADTFTYQPGTRALFPEVIDDMVKWAYQQDQFETTQHLVSQSRTTAGPVLLSTVVANDQDALKIAMPQPEGSRLPVRTITTGQNTVTFYKHGSALEWTYEFARRASLDLLNPYMARIARELALSEVRAATGVLINGDGVNGAAPEVTQFSFNTAANDNAAAGRLNWRHIICWLISRAKAGKPINTVTGNWDSFVQWLFMFTPTLNVNTSQVDAAAKTAGLGMTTTVNPLAGANLRFVLSSAVPSGKLIGFSKEDTLEELVEANSTIEESERAILNQLVRVTKSRNSGYRLVWGDTRSILDFSAAA